VKRTLALAVAPLLWLGLALPGCSSERDAARERITPEYDKTGRLQLLKYDSVGNGRVDTWSYMDGARVVRIEIDTNHDDRIDRWEYYDINQKLEKVGSSRRDDGIVDAWSFANADGGLDRIEISTARTGAVDRTEYYRREVMVRAEEDSDGDGAIDKWEAYDGARLTSVAFDTLHRGMPDRRLTYSAAGTAQLEFDREGDGHLLPVSSTSPAAASPSLNGR
jgi:hypothetical protein